MNNQIQIRPVVTGAPATRGEYADWPMGDRVAYANTLAQATDLIPRGLFDPQTGRPSPAKIFLVLETGVMLGIHPMAALAGIDVIEGTATVTPRLFGGLCALRGHDIEKVESGSIAGGDYSVTINFTRADTGKMHSETWDMRRTVQAGLVDSYTPDAKGVWHVVAVSSKKGEPLPWQQYPEDMCYWRALGRIARKHAADVLMGIGYFPEELEREVDRTGSRVQVDIEAEDALLERIAAVDDKADMAAIWNEQHYPSDQGGGARDTWTERVAAEFNAHLMRCTKDSRPPRPGAPGNTGDAGIDGKAESAPQPGAVPPQPADPGENVRTDADGGQPVSGAQNAALRGIDVVEGQVTANEYLVDAVAARKREEDVVDAEVVEDGDEFTLEVPEGDTGAYDEEAFLAAEVARHEREIAERGEA